ncbi:MAG: DUF1667 domain-containing protein [Acholeplasmataceae bacterium]
MTKTMTCVRCPIGCQLMIHDNEITGNRCKRGYEYARQELSCPKRLVTTTIKTTSKVNPRLPVKTDDMIEKKYVFDVILEARKLTVSPPVNIGDILIENLFKTGVNLVSTKKIDE